MDHELMKQSLGEIRGRCPTLHEFDKFMIVTAMKIADDDKDVAAAMLGLNRQTLNMRLKSLNMLQ